MPQTKDARGRFRQKVLAADTLQPCCERRLHTTSRLRQSVKRRRVPARSAASVRPLAIALLAIPTDTSSFPYFYYGHRKCGHQAGPRRPRPLTVVSFDPLLHLGRRVQYVIRRPVLGLHASAADAASYGI